MTDSPEQLVRRHVIEGARPGPHTLIIAGVHGDEFEPMAAVHRLITTIDRTALRGRVTLVPVTNAAAYASAKRAAEDGLDLARTCPGRVDGSITQRVAHAISALIKTADALVDLHTGGLPLDLLPLAGYMLHANDAVLATQRRMAKAFNLPLVWGTSATLDGRTLSVARDANVPAIYVEHGGGSYVPSRVDELVDGCLNVLVELGQLNRDKPTHRVKYVVEDRRSGSGHLQVNQPAPMDGLFQPFKRLGDIVTAGEPIGEVVDLFSSTRTPVPAGESGLLIMLRTWARVSASDPLGTIVPIDGQSAEVA